MHPENSSLTYKLVINDSKTESSIDLITFKSIISKALPNMDRPHIIRLLFDHRHQSLLAFEGKELIGGACFALFEREKFVELAFLAVRAERRIQGYGRKIMNKLKSVLQERAIRYMVTYGDNMALGFFRKQGFSQKITIPREEYEGFIKEYDGGKLMEFKVHPTVDYLNIDEIIKRQKEFVMETIKNRSINSTRFSGIRVNELTQEKPFKRITQQGEELMKRDPRTIPGVIESGWTWQQHDQIKKSQIEPFSIRCTKLLNSIKRHPQAKHFLQPVSPLEVPTYYTTIKNPIDLQTIEYKLQRHEYKNEEHFCEDIELIFRNCKDFNHPDSVYYRNGVKLEEIVGPDLRAFRHALISTNNSTGANRKLRDN